MKRKNGRTLKARAPTTLKDFNPARLDPADDAVLRRMAPTEAQPYRRRRAGM